MLHLRSTDLHWASVEKRTIQICRNWKEADFADQGIRVFFTKNIYARTWCSSRLWRHDSAHHEHVTVKSDHATAMTLNRHWRHASPIVTCRFVYFNTAHTCKARSSALSLQISHWWSHDAKRTVQWLVLLLSRHNAATHDRQGRQSAGLFMGHVVQSHPMGF